MRLAITTSHSVLTLNPKTGKIYARLHKDGLYYGITRLANTDYFIIAARRRLVSDPKPVAKEAGVILIVDAELRVWERWRAPFLLRDMHEIAWAHETLWVVCSYDDQIALRNAQGFWYRWLPLPLNPTTKPDVYHFNSLWFEQDLVWVLAHRRGSSLALAFPVAAALNGHTVAPLATVALGIQAHNLWRLNGELCTCSSGEGFLVGENGWRCKVNGFPRGIVHWEHGWIVGSSELAERGKRDFTTGQVIFFDPKWRVQKSLNLTKEGLILDLQIWN